MWTYQQIFNRHYYRLCHLLSSRTMYFNTNRILGCVCNYLWICYLQVILVKYGRQHHFVIYNIQ